MECSVIHYWSGGFNRFLVTLEQLLSYYYLIIRNGCLVRNTLGFAINTGNMAFSHLKYDGIFFCMNGMQKYCTDRTRCFCNRQLKISGRFLYKMSVFRVHFAVFRFLLHFVRLYIFSIVEMNMHI